MFCNKCGKEINDEAVVCVGCGCTVNETNSVKKKKWNEKPWGIVLQVFIWPLGLFMLYQRGFFTKLVMKRIGLVVVPLIIIRLILGPSEQDPCKCLHYMAFDAVKYRSCLQKDIDKAFDYAEKYNPDMSFATPESLVQFYWMEKCYK